MSGKTGLSKESWKSGLTIIAAGFLSRDISVWKNDFTYRCNFEVNKESTLFRISLSKTGSRDNVPLFFYVVASLTVVLYNNSV
ncbi:hypothetical protein, partial [Staphylococcus capitis]|uniref:hypothetical protein n=1 Tax=Staphylococcus capitis TaxID=29388 RepID=UPI00203E0FE5